MQGMEHLQSTIHAIINWDENQLQRKMPKWGCLHVHWVTKLWFHSRENCGTFISPTMGTYWCSRHCRATHTVFRRV